MKIINKKKEVLYIYIYICKINIHHGEKYFKRYSGMYQSFVVMISEDTIYMCSLHAKNICKMQTLTTEKNFYKKYAQAKNV